MLTTPKCYDCGKFCRPLAWKMIYSGVPPEPQEEIYKCLSCMEKNMNGQWLLIGGPANGKTVWTKTGVSLRWFDTDDQVYEYRGQNYLEGGKLYRVGYLDTQDLELSKVRQLIRESGVQPLADAWYPM